VGLLIVAVALVYYLAPDVEQSWQWITPSAMVAILGWLVASLGFSYYVNHFGSYNATYGRIGAVIVLLTWMYVGGFFVLVGGEINAEIEHASSSGTIGSRSPVGRSSSCSGVTPMVDNSL
jgi:membrane protein